MTCIRTKNLFWSCLGVIFWGLISIPSASADVAQGVIYLNGLQSVDYSYSNAADVSTPFQATAETLRAFQIASGTAQPGSASALDYLNAETHHNTENLARLIIANAGAGNDVQGLVGELWTHQNSDGGFGDFENYDSTVLDTAFALEALAATEEPQTNGTALAIDFLLGEQQSLGGWKSAPNEPTVYLSALAMRALWHYRTEFPGIDSALIRAQNYLLAQRDTATGLWSETFESALALIAIIPHSDEFSQVESMVTALRNQQQANGSWDDSVYATALALRALASQPVSLPPPVTTGGVKGKVLDSETRQPINGAVATIDGIAVSTSDLNGDFSFQNLDEATYNLRVGAAGYSEVVVSGVTVNAGAETVLTQTLLAPLPTSGVLQGQITDAVTGQSLSDVTVTVNGSSTASTHSALNGAYSLAGLTPGGITITLSLSGYLPITATATITAGQTVVFNPTLTRSSSESVPLPGTATTGVLRGQVTDENTGAPLSVAYVRVDDAATGTRLRAKATGVDGSYEIADLEPGAVDIEVAKPGYVSVTAHATVNAGNALTFSPALVPDEGVAGNVDETPMPSTPTTGVLKGSVTAADTGAALEAVAVTVDVAGSGARLRTVFTAADGSYQIEDLEPGDIVIQAGKTGYLTATATASVQAGNALLFNPGLVPEGGDPGTGTGDVAEEPLPPPTTGILQGVVTDANTGTPVDTAQVTVDDTGTGERLRTAFTGTDGAFTIEDLEPGDITIQVGKSGYLTAVANASAQAGVVLEFNPGLLPEEENLDDEVQEEPLPETPTTGQLQGVVTNAETGLPLGGAAVDVTGAFTGSIQTAADGSYLIQDIAPGAITVTVSLSGYLSVSASGSIAAGNAVVFSPALSPEDYVTSEPGRIIGRAVEAGTHTPLAHVVVEANGDPGTASTASGYKGTFEIDALDPGNYTLQLSLSDYVTRSLSVVLSSGGTVDLRDVELSPASGTVTVLGRITDSGTGQPIGDAVVSIMGTVISTQSDADGNYRLQELDPGNRTLMFNATGYNSQTVILDLSQPGQHEINRALTLTENSSLSLTFISTDRTAYNAYTAGEIHANVLNNGSPVEAMVTFSMFDAAGEFVSDFDAMRPGEQSRLILFEPGEIETVVAPFNTANLPPGDYRIIGRVLVGNQMIGPATAILDERTTEFTIDATRVIPQLHLAPIPGFSAVGVTETVNITADIVNRSNVPVDLSFSYDLLDPGGGVLRHASIFTIPLTPDQDSVSQVIDTFTQTFSESGEHTLAVAMGSNPLPDTVDAGVLSVAPGIRIDPGQSISPTIVTPDENQRVRITIRLEGREVQ
jgi:hypothetical protein